MLTIKLLAVPTPMPLWSPTSVKMAPIIKTGGGHRAWLHCDLIVTISFSIISALCTYYVYGEFLNLSIILEEYFSDLNTLNHHIIHFYPS